MTLQERFWSKVDRRGVDECWPWLGAHKPSGYGNFGLERGRTMGAHRMAWLLRYGGEIQPGVNVCHHCDNPACCNPEHLFLGTRSDNMSDAARKGRTRHPDNHGTNNGRAILTTADVQTIRVRYTAGGIQQRALADEYGVHPATIAAIVHRRNWAGVA